MLVALSYYNTSFTTRSFNEHSVGLTLAPMSALSSTTIPLRTTGLIDERCHNRYQECAAFTKEELHRMERLVVRMECLVVKTEHCSMFALVYLLPQYEEMVCTQKLLQDLEKSAIFMWKRAALHWKDYHCWTECIDKLFNLFRCTVPAVDQT